MVDYFAVGNWFKFKRSIPINVRTFLFSQGFKISSKSGFKVIYILKYVLAIHIYFFNQAYGVWWWFTLHISKHFYITQRLCCFFQKWMYSLIWLLQQGKNPSSVISSSWPGAARLLPCVFDLISLIELGLVWSGLGWLDKS